MEVEPKSQVPVGKKAAVPNEQTEEKKAIAAEDKLDSILKKSQVLAGYADHNHSGPREVRGHKLTEAEEDEEIVKEAVDEEEEEEPLPTRMMAQPSSVTGQMRVYQLEALNWLIHLHHSNLNGILADEMVSFVPLFASFVLHYLVTSPPPSPPNKECVLKEGFLLDWFFFFTLLTQNIVSSLLGSRKDTRVDFPAGVSEAVLQDFRSAPYYCSQVHFLQLDKRGRPLGSFSYMDEVSWY